ncbi:bifunctional diaminohydroxyphosphoribosylaminopyrimidine deaminase/5-amino-6-(5-phosphoribosylamino)uracil reductase RibD [Candidatus Viridilinea mediisalina]|uniref:Riboflavin biosynthesis protein RibD n=1 Tax=Candidatus Viridilinea mediisalina TaxID=2024553 RepID=A0A2A6RDA8_9CHLR|nr:bifunctional diaminohydroxyphosphoribosylaminopyrimidine deaminase/5-amino-6-(5-phosphoribosylamino)uracil reductase RibD [Candidatus Viridilinea mediisalina]PDV98409.1 riboflavin biosynthesis protein RibD [Candidatus Viridilinea mediisalina]
MVDPPDSGGLDGLKLAIQQAQLVVGRTSPNPPVGAVVLRAGRMYGVGATQAPGGLHAERVALQQAGANAQGADLFVSLEPCTFHGRTPPCTEAIIAAGIRRVFYVARDPDPRMGAGAEPVLRAAGIEVVRCADPQGHVADLLAPFRCRVLARRPLVSAKYAMTLDGRIATAQGDSRWITGPLARQQVHRLRDRVDALMVGSGTIRADDPQLTTRLDTHWRMVRHPLRVVVDSYGRTPLSAHILDPQLPGITLMATVAPNPAWCAAVQARGIHVEQFPPAADGRVDLHALLAYLAEQRGINHLLVEGGAVLLGALAQAGLLDEIYAFIGPKLVGASDAPGPLAGAGVARMAEAPTWTLQRVERYEQDVLLLYRVAHASWWGGGRSGERGAGSGEGSAACAIKGSGCC